MEKVLGSGAFGIVTKAKFKVSGEFVAVKIMKNEIWQELSKKKQSLRSFEHEIKILKLINHQNIIRFLGISFDEVEQQLAIVTEYIEGQTLENILLEKDISIEESILIIKQIIDGVAYLHDNTNKQ